MGSWRVPLLLPKETHSEGAALWAGVAEAWSQDFMPTGSRGLAELQKYLPPILPKKLT